MKVHCVALNVDNPQLFGTECGEPALSKLSVSDVNTEINCELCIIRLLARLHADQAVLLQNLAHRIVELRKQAESAVARD